MDCLIRLWDLREGNCLRSYPLEVIDAPDYEDEEQDLAGVTFHNGVIKPTSRKVQYAKLEPYGKRQLYVALEGGYLQVNNIYSGAIIYNKSVEDNLKLEHEISDILFFKQGSKQSAGVACWEGFVSFISQPSVSNGVESIKANTKPSSHIGDIVSLDVTAKDQMVSGSIDNRICFWTGYTGKQGACIAVPSAADGRGCNNFIQAVRFADRESADTVVVVMSEGEVYVLEQQSQTFQMPNGSRSKKGTPPVSIISIPRKNEFALDGDSAGEEPTFDTKIHPHSVV